MKNLKYLPFVLVIILFLITRFYQISTIPISLYWDEASIGYNAYAILSTGKDEWGKTYPLNFRAFGEFKLPTYIYSVALSEEFFGVNALAVRLPAVAYSLATLILTFLLTLKLTKNRWTAFFSSFFLTTSPWFFIFSRVGYEATAGLAFFVLAVYLLCFVKEKKYLLVISAVSLLLSMYSYNSFRVVVPVFVGGLLLFSSIRFKKELWQLKWTILAALALLLVGVLPIIHSYFSDTGAARFNTISILNETDSKVELVKLFIGNYLSHFSPSFLFINGDTQSRMQLGGWGELSIIELPFLLLGLWRIFQKKTNWLILFIILIAPLPAAITKESPHSLRAVIEIPFLCILAALGLESLGQVKSEVRKIILGIVTGGVLIYFTFYSVTFFQSYNIRNSEDWQYPYKQIYTQYQTQIGGASRVLVTDEYAQPYIFALYYQKFNPVKYQKNAQFNSPSDWGFSTVSSFDKFVFPKQLNLDKIERSGDLVFSAKEQPNHKDKQLGIINFLDGTSALWVYKI